jgi:hypothetical protein
MLPLERMIVRSYTTVCNKYSILIASTTDGYYTRRAVAAHATFTV